MELLIDNREHKKRIDNLQNFISNEDIKSNVKQLNTGDYIFDNGNTKVAFEYKTVNDLISSIQNNSLFEEIINMQDEYQYSYLIIEGLFVKEIKSMYYKRNLKAPLDKYIKSNISIIDGAINRILSMMIPVIIVEDEELAFKKMIDISNKVFDEKIYIIGRKRAIKSSDNPALIYLSGVKNLNIKTAELVTNELNVNCLKDLFEFNEEKLLNIKGIGKVKAQMILKSIYG